jgi:coproporphyrinogen III oxidase
MRFTINLEDDLYAMARAHSVAEGISISQAVNALLRIKQKGGNGSKQTGKRRKTKMGGLHPKSGVPVSTVGGKAIPTNAVAMLNEKEDDHAYPTI